MITAVCYIRYSLSNCCVVIVEGIELLCLIDKGVDACRYLQTYGHWQEATWLAKVVFGYFFDVS